MSELLQEAYNDTSSELMKTQLKLEKLQKSHDVLLECVEFYANEKNWREAYYGEMYIFDGDVGDEAIEAIKKSKQILSDKEGE